MYYAAPMPEPLLSPFRKVAFVEGISYLVLLGVAMPLKYLAGLPLAVRVVGSAHGLLFIAYVVLAGLLWLRRSWSFWFTGWALFLSLVPFGTFWLERQLVRAEMTTR
jgi:integral membrane protein